MPAFTTGFSTFRFSALALLALLCGLVTIPAGEAHHVPNVLAVVKAGPHVRSVAVNETTNRVYIGNESGDTVSVMDGATNTLIDTDGNGANGVTPITVGDFPISTAANSDTNRVYTANFSGNSVTVVDGGTNSVLTTIATGGAASGIGVNQDTNRIYVGDQTNDSLDVIDGATNTVLTTIPLFAGADPHSFGVAVNEVTNRVYVADWPDSMVSVINGATNTKITDISVGSGVSGVGVNPVTDRIYVAATNEDAVKVIDGQTNTVIASIGSITDASGVAVDSTTNRIYVTEGTTNRVVVIDGATNLVVSSITLTPRPFAIAFNTVTDRAMVGSWDNDVLSVVAYPPHPLGASLVNFQGRLTDTAGNPVANGNYSITFRLYDAATAGSLKWIETQTVPVSGSVFSVLLGSVAPLEAAHFNGEPRFLEVQVGADPPLMPRQRFTSVPFAFNAQAIDGIGSTQFLRSDTSSTFAGTTLTVGTGGNVQRLKVVGQGVIENDLSETIWTLKNTSSMPNEWLIFATGTGSTKGTRKFAIQDNTGGMNADRLTIDSAGNVGVGTNTPGSRLHVPSGYLQIPTLTGAAPPAGDCDDAAEAGRMVARTDGAVNLYICTGAAGWVGK